jgi:DNA-binding transcriptional ArsR family regulator
MSRRRDIALVTAKQAYAPVFAALGDGTRLLLIRKLCLGQPRSISELTEDSELTRQAITKHLRVLENVGLVHGERRGREMLFRLTPKPMEEAKKYLDLVSEQWEQTLARLKSFIEADTENKA